MTDQQKNRRGLDQFTKDVLYSALVGVTSTALVSAAVALLMVMVVLIFTGGNVPTWTLLAVAGVGAVYLSRRVVGREAEELRPALKAAEAKLDRHDSYGSNLCSVLDTFQRILAGDIKNIRVPAFIERGILIPARDVMQENGHSNDLRLSVLIASEGHFQMPWAAGHRVGSQEKYRQPINKTISKVAFEKKLPMVWKDAPSEEKSFAENPHATRGFKSMVSVPILVGDSPTGVFNVITNTTNAFDPADINYLTSLGSIIQVAVGLAIKELREAKRAPTAKAATVAHPAPHRIMHSATPGRAIGSGGATNREEGSDE